MSYNPERHHRNEHRTPDDLHTPVRNHYFYGKLLDVFHLELEQTYFNSKRHLLNRLVTGPGVVCGLDVRLTDDGVVVMPGFAIDRCGREIIVASPSRPVPLPPLPEYRGEQSGKGYESNRQGRRGSKSDDEYEGHYYCEIPFAHVVLCYHECESEPTPALAGDCETVTLCASGSIREQYKVKIKEGYAPVRQSNFPRNAIQNGELNYPALARYVTDNCRPWPDDCCLPLANIELREEEDHWEPEVDISVRPIVYTNRLLLDLIRTLVRREETENSEV